MKKETKSVKETAASAVKTVQNTAAKVEKAAEDAKVTAAEVKEKAVNTTKAAAKTVKAAEDIAAKTVKAAEDKAVKTVKAAEEKAEETVKAASAAVKKAPVNKAVKETIYLQYMGKEINKDDIIAQIKKIWTDELNKKASDLKEITLYLKTDDNAAYYVINGEVTGKIAL